MKGKIEMDINRTDDICYSSPMGRHQWMVTRLAADPQGGLWADGFNCQWCMELYKGQID